MSTDHVNKATLRAELLQVRRGLTADDRAVAARRLAPLVRELPEIAAADTVAAYVSMGSEPGTRDLIEALRLGGTRVLLPVLMADNDLDWAVYQGPQSL